MKENWQSMKTQSPSTCKLASAFGTPPPEPLIGPRLHVAVRDTLPMAMVAAMPQTTASLVASFAEHGIDLPVQPGVSARSDNGTLAHCQSPGRWLLEISVSRRPNISPDMGVLTDLGHARCSFVIEGADAIELAQKLAPIDFSLDRHRSMSFVQSGSDHGVNLAIWRKSAERFIFYVERSFSRDFWHSLQAESAEFRV